MLGIFLLAVLAQVCGIVGITAEWEEMGEVEVRKAIEAFGREMRGYENDGGGGGGGEEEEVRGLLGRGENEAAEDAGQVVSREGEGEVAVASVADGIGGEDERLGVLPARSVGDTRKRKSEGTVDVKKKKKKRKRVGGDAIDDIFG